MKILIVIVASLTLVGCSTSGKGIAKFPDAPPSLTQDVGTLKTIKETK